MASNDRVLAKRYAQALFENAGAAQSARVRKELGAALKLLRNHTAALRHPLSAPAEKVRLMKELVGDQVGADVRRFLELLILRKRFELLPYAAAEMEKIADEATRTARAHVRAARPLSDAEKAEIEKRLGAYLKKTVIADVKEDPSLIGGLVVKVGDLVLDASVLRQLSRMKEKLLSA